MSINEAGDVPMNPPMFSGKPKINGRARMVNERLYYLNPLTHNWHPAVRLDTIRAQLIQQEKPDLYDHPKSRGIEATDVTSILAKDSTFGYERETRAPILFQIQYTNGVRGEQPKGYLTVQGEIALDPFDHGIRDFPELPKCLSSSLGGHDITYYMRQNQHIRYYDILARMPSTFRTKKNEIKTPAYSTIGMRATRFRMIAGLLTWANRDGSSIKNEKILKFIPDSCKDPSVNSTRDFRDLTEEEQDALDVENNRKKRAKYTRATTGARDADEEPLGVNGRNEEELEVITIADEESTLDDPTNGDGLMGPIDQQTKSPYFQKQDRCHFSDDSEEERRTQDAKPLCRKLLNRRSTRVGLSDQVSLSHSKEFETEDQNARPNGDAQEGSKEHTQPAGKVNREAPIQGNSINQPIEIEPSINSMVLTAIQGSDPLTARIMNARANLGQIPQHLNQLSSVNANRQTPEPDYRHTLPNTYSETADEDIKCIQQAVQLCRIDYFQRIGAHPPGYLIEAYKLETYNMQRTRLHDVLSNVWKRPGYTPQLYWLSGWKGGFGNWRSAVNDQKGQELLRLLDAE